MSKYSGGSDDDSLNIAFFSVLVVSLSLLFVFSEGEALPKEAEEKTAIISSLEKEIETGNSKEREVLLAEDNIVLASSSPTHYNPPVLASSTKEKEKETEKRWVRVTAYAPLDPNAKEGMCFSGDPMMTASGTRSREGVVAANFLPFGTKIKIPSLFGERIFTVEDRMSSKYQNTVDVIVSSREEAIRFGSKRTYIEIIK